jgi:DNA-binding NarL/FixJ family response regulator
LQSQIFSAYSAGCFSFFSLRLKAVEYKDVKPLVKHSLTKREQEIAALIAKELNYKMISTKLKISVRTVETHVHNIHNKTGAHNVAGVINHINANKNK